ncbi:MAG: endopeptidase IV [Gammaproteobacteria bacterium RIFCSPHIGHO2_12_FULL_41_15]|nr:MAG: endopeptidase IV [Gammaproteobacteria bacterium RIFCSPHIGHO2_12_FULL_41_15]
MRKIIKVILSIALIAAVGEILFAESRYYGGNLCAYEGFHCVKVKSGDTWAKLFPNEHEREIVKRLNRTNLPLYYRSWIVVPRDLKQLTLMDLSPFPDQMETNGQKLVLINLGVHAFGAYGPDGKLVHWGPISGGKGWCPDIHGQCNTVVGQFNVVEKKGPECVSDKFPVETEGGAPMPYCMYFYRGFAMHGSTLPGYHASHGCVRLFFEDAQWLNRHFVDVGTRVILSR